MKILKQVALALSLSLAASLAAAFPDKPVRIVVPYPPGGPIDISTRLLAERLHKVWQQPVVVENRPGASGAIGTDAVLKSPADGYTLLIHSPILIATELNRPVNYRTLRDLVPVTKILASPVVYVASNSGTSGGIKDILAAAAAAPGALSFGSHGDGTTAHYMGERLARNSHVKMTHVPYAGEAPIIAALMGGHVSTAFISGVGAKKVADSGKGRILAVSSKQRSPLMPDVPTFAELGFAGFDRNSWGMFFVATGTPDAIVQQLSRDIDRIVQQPDIRQRFMDLGVEARSGTAAEAKAEVKDDYEYWGALINELGVLAK